MKISEVLPMLNRKNLIETQQNMSEFLKYYDSQMEKINGLKKQENINNRNNK